MTVVSISSGVVVLEESPCPRGSPRTNLQVLVLVLGPQVLVLGNIAGFQMLSGVSEEVRDVGMIQDPSPTRILLFCACA